MQADSRGLLRGSRSAVMVRALHLLLLIMPIHAYYVAPSATGGWRAGATCCGRRISIGNHRAGGAFSGSVPPRGRGRGGGRGNDGDDSGHEYGGRRRDLAALFLGAANESLQDAGGRRRLSAMLVWKRYVKLLVEYPLITKATTAGIIASIGDFLAQRLEHRISGEGRLFSHSRSRALAVAVDGMFVTGPGLHMLYGALERYIPTAARPLAACLHIMFDTFIFDPMFVGTFFCTTALLEGKSVKQDLVPQLQREYFDAVKGALSISMAFWPIQYFSFRYLPVQFRVLCVNCCDVIWTASLSFFSHKPER